MGEHGGVPEEEKEPRPSVNQEKETKDPEERDGLSDGSLKTTSEHETSSVGLVILEQTECCIAD